MIAFTHSVMQIGFPYRLGVSRAPAWLLKYHQEEQQERVGGEEMLLLLEMASRKLIAAESGDRRWRTGDFVSVNWC